MTDASSYDVTPEDIPAAPTGNSRKLRQITGDRVTLEYFGCSGAADSDDSGRIKTALEWSRDNDRPVYADREYRLDSSLIVCERCWLKASPAARFIRNFGDSDSSKVDDDSVVLVTTDGEKEEVRIEGGVWGPSASATNTVGPVFRLDSPRGVLTMAKLVRANGVQLTISGDGFRLSRIVSRLTPLDAGGGLRLANGRSMIAEFLDLETSDDCFQFNPTKSLFVIGQAGTVEYSIMRHLIGKTTQGALLAFISGGDMISPLGGPDYTRIRHCRAYDIVGEAGGTAGGAATLGAMGSRSTAPTPSIRSRIAGSMG